MHIRPLPMQLDQIRPLAAPKPSEAKHLRDAFEQTMALAVNDRSPSDRRQP